MVIGQASDVNTIDAIILIVSAVKIYKHCLHTVESSLCFWSGDFLQPWHMISRHDRTCVKIILRLAAYLQCRQTFLETPESSFPPTIT